MIGRTAIPLRWLCVSGQAKEETYLQAGVLSDRPMLAVGSLLTRNLWFTLPEFCKFVDRGLMSVLRSPSAGYNFLLAKRPYSPWYPEPESPSKRIKAKSSLWNWDRASSSRQLATFPCSVSPAENPHPRASECLVGASCSTRSGAACAHRYFPEISQQTYSHGESDVLSTSSERAGCLPMVSEEKKCSENWELRVVVSSRCKSPSLVASDVIGTIDFNADGELFATGGIARKIRICQYARMTSVDIPRSADEDDESYSDEDDRGPSESRYSSTTGRGRGKPGPTVDHADYALAEICTPGKLSSLKWRPDGSEVIGCADYDGVVSEWDIEHKHTVSEWYEHSGHRVWSLDYSRLSPTLAGSASGDGTVRLWNRGLERSVCCIRPPNRNSVCCAEFSPFSQYHIAIASADSNVYLYDLRHADSTLLKFEGHEKAVSYVRFLTKDKVVSASVDSTLRLWNTTCRSAAAADDLELDSERISSGHLEMIFRDHVNVKNFVGLSVHREAGLLACGSETNEVFMYRNSSTTPIRRHKLSSKGFSSRDRSSRGNPFIGAVCWREVGNNYSMVAANSEGVVQVLQAHQVDHSV